MNKKEIQQIEQLMRKYDIEISAICKGCNTHWGTLDDHEIIRTCETCKTGKYLEHYAELDDVIKAISEM